jgi:transcription elongation factor Elf1
MLHVDTKYVRLISGRLRNFKQKNTNLWNFSCPFCGDSQTNKTKARGYVFVKGTSLLYRCHNCGVSTNAANLIKRVDPNLFKEYSLERFKESTVGNANNRSFAIDVPTTRFGKVQKQRVFEHAEWISQLPAGHFCLTYVQARKIPLKHYNKFMFTPNYEKFIKALVPDIEKDISNDARLVIPYYNQYDELIAVTGRALENASEKLRYVHVRMNDSKDKLIYGMDRVDLEKTVYIVEGQIDSLFLKNCIASGDSALGITANLFQAVNKILVFDNEPRNKEIVKLMQNAIKSDHNVVIWPETIEGKDINEMVMHGLDPAEIQSIIDSNTFRGLEAQLKFNYWKKVQNES